MPDCGLDVALAVIGGKWKMLILFHVCHGTRRFGELRRLLPGISEKMLIQDLRQMQESGLLARKDYKEVPPKVEYSITPFGRALGEALRPLCAWGIKNRKRVFVNQSPSRQEARARGSRAALRKGESSHHPRKEGLIRTVDGC